MKIDINTLAGQLYTTYCAAVGGKAFNNDPLPSWDEFSKDPNKKKQSDAWISTALEALKRSSVIIRENFSATQRLTAPFIAGVIDHWLIQREIPDLEEVKVYDMDLRSIIATDTRFIPGAGRKDLDNTENEKCVGMGDAPALSEVADTLKVAPVVLPEGTANTLVLVDQGSMEANPLPPQDGPWAPLSRATPHIIPEEMPQAIKDCDMGVGAAANETIPDHHSPFGPVPPPALQEIHLLGWSVVVEPRGFDVEGYGCRQTELGGKDITPTFKTSSGALSDAGPERARCVVLDHILQYIKSNYRVADPAAPEAGVLYEPRWPELVDRLALVSNTHALYDACRTAHGGRETRGIRDADGVTCICGASGEGSKACKALKAIKDVVVSANSPECEELAQILSWNDA